MSQYDELKALAIEADRRGDKQTAWAAMQKMESIGQTTAPTAEPRRPLGTPQIGQLETAATLGSAMLAQPVAGLTGLVTAPFEGGEKAGQRVRDVQEALTYAPRTEFGQAGLREVATALEPVGKVLEAPGKALGGKTMEVSGSPAAAAFMETLPTAVLMLAGIKRAPKVPAGPVPERVTEAAQTIAAGERADIPVLTSDVFPPETFIGKNIQSNVEKTPIIGTGSMRADQQLKRQTAIEGFANQYAGGSYEDIVKSLVAQKDKVKSAAGNVIQTTGAKLDSVGPVPTPRTSQAIAQMTTQLNKPNVVSVSGKAGSDVDATATALNQPQTFTTLKENRTAYRELKEGVDPATGSQMPSNAKRLAENVYAAMTQDMKDFARQHLTPAEFSKWERANAVYQEEATKLTKTRLKNVLDTGALTPENVGNLLFSKKPSEVRLLYDSLTPAGRSHARSALITKAVENVSGRADGFNPNSFLNELNKISGGTDVFFKGAEKKQLEGLRRALDATRRAQTASAAPPTGQNLWYLVTGGLIYANPKAAAVVGTAAGAARLYESAAVRNALLKLASKPPSGPAFELELATTRQTIAATASALANDPTLQPEQPVQQSK